MDRERHLRFNFNAMCRVEKATGLTFTQVINPKEFGMSTLRLLLWAGLIWEDKHLTIEDTGELIDAYIENGGRIEDVGGYLTDAMAEGGWLVKPDPNAPPDERNIDKVLNPNETSP
jgi:hypothetical protein